RLEVEALSTLLLRPGSALPSVLSGRVVIQAPEAIILGSVEVIPLGAARLVLEPGNLMVEEGRVRVAGEILEKGARWPLEEEEPNAVGDDASPGASAPDSSGALELFPAGKALDAATGAGIPGARVLAVYFH